MSIDGRRKGQAIDCAVIINDDRRQIWDNAINSNSGVENAK